MRYPWNSKSIKWYMEAEKTTSFYKRIKNMVGPCLDGVDSVLDVGCGPGSLTMELVGSYQKVEAIDISVPAVSALRERVEGLGFTNIGLRSLSFEDLPYRYEYDAVFLCYVMGLVREALMEKILRHSREYVFLVIPSEGIKNDFNIKSLAQRLDADDSELKQPCYKEIVPVLDRLGLSYSVHIFESEFGQPFYDMEEAADFFRHYFPIFAEKEQELSQWLSESLEYVSGGYYLPNTRKSVLITIEK